MILLLDLHYLHQKVLKQTMCEVDLKIDYKTEEFTFFNLKVCETVSIEKVEEIEVF